MFDMLEIFFINERFDQICLWLNRKKEMWNSYHQICFHFSKENCSWRNLFVFFLVWNLFFCFCDHFNERIWLDLSATACSRCIHFIERMLSIVTFFLISFSFFVFFLERECVGMCFLIWWSFIDFFSWGYTFTFWCTLILPLADGVQLDWELTRLSELLFCFSFPWQQLIDLFDREIVWISTLIIIYKAVLNRHSFVNLVMVVD